MVLRKCLSAGFRTQTFRSGGQRAPNVYFLPQSSNWSWSESTDKNLSDFPFLICHIVATHKNWENLPQLLFVDGRIWTQRLQWLKLIFHPAGNTNTQSTEYNAHVKIKFVLLLIRHSWFCFCPSDTAALGLTLTLTLLQLLNVFKVLASNIL